MSISVPTEPRQLHIENLQVHYGRSLVLQGVNLRVPPGAITAIVGRNGVGKTTLIHTIMGMLTPTAGSIRLGEVDLSRHPSHARKAFGLALVPQGRRLFPSLTVEEHLRLVPPIAPTPHNLETIYELFPRLRERRRALASTLSGGERSMLAVGRALILNPSLLLMDEPTEGLAPLLVEAIGEVIRQQRQQNLTVLLVEQRLAFALSVANRIAVMARGRIVGVYTPDEIDDADELAHLILYETPAG